MNDREGRFASAARALVVLTVVLVGVATLASVASADTTVPTPPWAAAYKGPGFHRHVGSNGEADVNICSYDTSPGLAHCNAHVRTDNEGGNPGNTPSASRNPRAPSPAAIPNGVGYGPTDLQAAYNLTSLSTSNGAGKTVAIVDAYDNPKAKSDLDNYRSAAGLPPLSCSGGNPCFTKMNQNGSTSSFPSANAGWAQEISLDLDMASAICPKCNLLLVEASSNSWANLGAAVNRAAATAGVVAISNSWSSNEFSSETNSTYDGGYFNHPGIAITAASGDSGYGVQYPASSRNVIGVGGTHLTKSGSPATYSETVWKGAGSGCSAYETKPSWQTDTGCTRRTVADVSAVADPATGVAVYDSYSGGSTWKTFGGTSVSSPIIAAVFALNHSSPAANLPASDLYANTGALNDVTSGSNGSCGGSYLCTAQVGYDGPTGLGTPNGGVAFSAVPPTPDFSITATPVTVNEGASGSSTITLGALNNYPAGNVTLSASVTAGKAGDLTLPASSSVAVPGSSSLTVGANLGSGGSYTVKVTATDSSSLSHDASFLVTVNKQDFSISATPSSLALNIGDPAKPSTISLVALNGYSSSHNVSLSATFPGDQTALTVVQPTSPVHVGDSPVLTIAGNKAGSYVVTVTATDDSSPTPITHNNATITVTVTDPNATPNFTISVSPTSAYSSRGGTVTITVTINGTIFGPGGATMSVTGYKTGDVATWTVNPVTAAGTTQLKLKLGTTSGSRSLTIKAANGSYSKTATVSVYAF
jgi:hypothetical protein